MDLYESPEVRVKQKSFKGEETLKPVLVTLEKQNVTLPKIRTGPATKYKSDITPSAPYYFASPFIPKRTQSAERKRPNTMSPKPSSPTSPSARRSAPSSPLSRITMPSSPASKPSTPPTSSRSTTPVRDSIVEKQHSSRRSFVGRAPDGLWPSVRNLSSSFQTESFIHASKKDRPARGTSLDPKLRNSATALSERKRTPLTGKNTSEQSENFCPFQDEHLRVVDQHRWPAMSGGKVSTMAFSRTMDLSDRIEKSASLMFQSRGLLPTRRILGRDGIIRSVHNLSNEVAQLTSLEATAKNEHDINFGVSIDSQSHHAEKEKPLPATNPCKTMSLPMNFKPRPSSPYKASMPSSLASKGISITSRPSSPFHSSNDMEDAHQLRLLNGRELQWRFINSRANFVSATQEIIAENILNNGWNVTSELLDSVTMKRIDLQSLKLEMKLDMHLKEQLSYLEDFIALEEEYSTSLYGTIEAMKAGILRLPVSSGTRADVRSVKNALSSAIDIMQAMGSSVCYLLYRVEGTKHLVSQLYSVTAQEKQMLDECRVLLAATAAMQVEECCLRAQILQLGHEMHIWSTVN